MKYIEGTPREQTHLFPVSLEDSIDSDNEVRLIDLFVDSLNLEDFGFKMHFVENGRPAYRPADLLKLYIYGYMNKIRSSRALEKESKRNIEIMWLIHTLSPDHNTIANFRKDNPKAIKKVFRATVEMARNFNLIGDKLIAGDSTKLRAQNSKKNNFNKKKIARHISYIDAKIDEHNKALAEADGDQKKKQVIDKIDQLNQRRKDYENLENELEKSGQEQISTSDTESRQMIIRNNITEVAYNVQASIDAKNCLPVDYEVTNQNDSKAMGKMVRRAKSIVRNNSFTVLFDKGYHTGTELKIALDLGITTLVAERAAASNAPDLNYNVANFFYDELNDHYRCPQGHLLTSNGKIYTKHAKRQTPTTFKQYKTKACKNCPVRQLCTKAKNGKLIERNSYTEYIERNRENVEQNPSLYKKRQAVVEHPFGTIKRQWGFSYIMTKQGKKRASADVGLIFIAYNLKRMINILGKDAFRDYLTLISGQLYSIFCLIRSFFCSPTLFYTSV